MPAVLHFCCHGQRLENLGIVLARILLAWELGGGLGHIVRFERLTRELQKRGHAVRAALPHFQHANRLNLEPDNIRIVPEWPGIVRRRHDRKGISWITYGDMLADIIFTDAKEIAGHIAKWRDVFGDTKADVVIADYAPGAVLAARNFLSCVNMGVGYTLPPHDLAEFPRLWPGDGPLKHRESDVTARINIALAQHGAKPLINYPDVNAATAQAVMTIPLLDVYREFRSGGWLGAGPFTLPTTLSENRAGLFATLHEVGQFDRRLIEGIAGSGVGGVVVVPKLLRRNRKLLADAGFQTPEELQPLNEVLEKARVLVHHGGMATAIAGIAKGVPQLIIHSDLEKYHTGKSIVDAGAGLALRQRTVTKQQISSAIKALVHDPAYLERTMRLAEANNDLLKTSSISALADLAESIA